MTATLWTIANYLVPDYWENWEKLIKFGVSPYLLVFAITLIVALFNPSADVLGYGNKK